MPMPVSLDQGRAACADHLDLVDAAAEKPGGPEARQMKRELCRTCPVLQACGLWAYTHVEPAGIWAGTSPKQRTRYRRTHPAR